MKHPETVDRDDLAPEQLGPPVKRSQDCPGCGENIMCLAIDKVYTTSAQRWCCLNCGCAFTGPEIERHVHTSDPGMITISLADLPSLDAAIFCFGVFGALTCCYQGACAQYRMRYLYVELCDA